ncbi:hypothetical protein [Nocardioides sp.]|uniref:hypothetical protein n=1 Tax=Nocardioides sp. TaxID=35761 RepID=UPI0035AE4582
MTRRKQYKKRLPTVLPPAPRTDPEARPQAAAPEAPPVAPALPTPRAPEPEPAPVPGQTTADFVREMKQRAGVVETAPAGAEEDADEDLDDDLVEVDEAEDEEAAPSRSRRPARPLALIGVLLVGIATGALAYWWSAGDDGSPAPEGAWVAPSGLAADEGYVETRVHADGTMEVRQWIRADEPLERLTLHVPRVTSAGQLAADRVEVLADGARIGGREEISYFNATYDLGGATEVELRYRLVGALQRSDSAPGRALAVATALEARFSRAPAREVRVVKAPEVLSLACTPAADVSPVPCGTPDGAGEWHVDLAGRRVSERVVASLTIR